jgi:hypothetical protein
MKVLYGKSSHMNCVVSIVLQVLGREHFVVVKQKGELFSGG